MDAPLSARQGERQRILAFGFVWPEQVAEYCLCRPFHLRILAHASCNNVPRYGDQRTVPDGGWTAEGASDGRPAPGAAQSKLGLEIR